jgi:Domain of unknown function (DUF6438)
MERNNQQGCNPSRPRSRVPHLTEVAFGLNLISAIAYAMLVYVDTHDLDYYLLRAAIRVDDILHFSQTNAVTTEALRRHSQNVSTLAAGMELAILISMFAVMMLVLLFLSLIPNAWYRVIMGNRCSGFLALFALPVSCLCALFWHASPDSASWYADANTAFQSRYMHRLFWLLFAADVLCVAILFLVSRVRPLSTWTIGILLVFHCAFWLIAMSPPPSLVSGMLSLSLVVFPLSGAVWLRDLKTTDESATARGEMRQVGKWTIAGLVVSGALVLVIWSPQTAYSLAQPRNIGSLSIELSRGPCFGSCPSYSLTLHGDGLVEYRGIRFVRVKETQTARISTEQLMQVLRDLDRMDFFSVEDRAFQWCFDTASTSIFVSVDGRQKRVTTDTCGVGLKGGPKARFLQIADEIDTIASSKQWVQCNGLCRN